MFVIAMNAIRSRLIFFITSNNNSLSEMEKTVCFTIDVEPDFGGLLINDVYFGKNDLPKLANLVSKYKLKLTAFATGKALEENPDILELLVSMKAEIEQHSYSHQIAHHSKVKDIEKGIETYEKMVGKRPLGYRSPQGIITREEALFLESMGIKFDSSIFPTFFPGRFNRVNCPTVPFVIKGSNLVEIPFAVVPNIRVPISLSYMQLLGFNTFRFFFVLLGLPKLVVYGSHMSDLGKVPSYNQLPMTAKGGYYRAQRIYNDPAAVFEKFVKYILSKDYQSKYMIDVYRELESNISITYSL